MRHSRCSPPELAFCLILSIVTHQILTMQLWVRSLLVFFVTSSISVAAVDNPVYSVQNGSCPRKLSCRRPQEELLTFMVPLFAEPTQFAKYPGLVVEIWAKGTQVELDVFTKQRPEDCVSGEKILMSNRASGEDHMRFHYLSSPGVCSGAKRPPVNRFNISMIYQLSSEFFVFWKTCDGGGYKLSAVLVDCRWRWGYRDQFSESRWRRSVEENLLPNDTLKDLVLMEWDRRLYGDFWERRWKRLALKFPSRFCGYLEEMYQIPQKSGSTGDGSGGVTSQVLLLISLLFLLKVA